MHALLHPGEAQVAAALARLLQRAEQDAQSRAARVLDVGEGRDEPRAARLHLLLQRGDERVRGERVDAAVDGDDGDVLLLVDGDLHGTSWMRDGSTGWRRRGGEAPDELEAVAGDGVRHVAHLVDDAADYPLNSRCVGSIKHPQVIHGFVYTNH